MNAITKNVADINDGHSEQADIRVKLLECFYYIAFRNRSMSKTTLLY